MSSLGSSVPQLPENAVVDILSRLPAKTILQCRCVCKSWYNLLTNSTYFINLHLSRSPAALIIHHDPGNLLHIRPHPDPGLLKLVEIEDKPNYHNLRHDPTLTIDLNLGASFQKSKLLLVGSVNGLLCLWQFDRAGNTYICNPITREYLILPKQQYYRTSYAIIVYGFGVSSLTGEYKVVRIFQGDIPPDPTSTSRPSLLEGEIYTFGTGKWRSLGHVPYWLEGFYSPFLNGHMHWLVRDEDALETICSFDFDNELFQLFPSPPKTSGFGFEGLGVLGGCLCKHSCSETEFVIWVMKEYGIKKSWTKQISITTSNQEVLDRFISATVHVIKDLKDGTILMIHYDDFLLAYCPERITIENTQIFPRSFSGMCYTPSFIGLRNFAVEKVCESNSSKLA